jgi:Tfp pilus assembly protein PilV
VNYNKQQKNRETTLSTFYFLLSTKGFSLIELMIALVILQVSLLGLLSVMVTSISSNLDNEVRNTAIRLTTQTAEAIYSLDFEDGCVNDADGVGGGDTTYSRDVTNGLCVSSDHDLKGFPQRVQRIRGGFDQTYNISWTVSDQSADLKEVEITVTYTDPKGVGLSNSAVIYKHSAL